MSIFRTGLMILAASLAITPAVALRTHHASGASAHVHAASSSHSGRSAHGRHRGVRRAAVKHRLHGQQEIAPDRAMEIQQALIREHYLTGPATGEWDDTTVAAMQKYQADQGWQTKLMPDSRALKKLGLGADYSNAINAKSGGFSGPISTDTTPASQTAGFAAASGVNQ